MKEQKRKFRSYIGIATRILWIATVCDTLYILKYAITLRNTPAWAMDHGMSWTLVPPMAENVVFGIVLILLGCLTAEVILKT